MKSAFYKLIFYRLMGWRITGHMDPVVRKCVMIVVPHTSWHDFYIGLFARGIIGLEMHYVAKKELFRFPFGFYFRWMGGAPLDRSGNRNSVDAIAAIFRERDVFRLAIAPEGTRKKVSEWKTGFYYIAQAAGVPILPIAFDYRKKEVRLYSYVTPTGDIKADMTHLQSLYAGVRGKLPDAGFPLI